MPGIYRIFPSTPISVRVPGIRLRLPNGRKLSVRGGREGVFLPDGLKPGGRLLVCEGPSDTAALLDLGFQAVGRPSRTGGTRHVVRLAQRLRPAEVVIMADADEPGQKGAEGLASHLVIYAPTVRVIAPPHGATDARAWKAAGATAAEVRRAIDAAPVWQVKVTSRAKDIKAWNARVT